MNETTEILLMEDDPKDAWLAVMNLQWRPALALLDGLKVLRRIQTLGLYWVGINQPLPEGVIATEER